MTATTTTVPRTHAALTCPDCGNPNVPACLTDGHATTCLRCMAIVPYAFPAYPLAIQAVDADVLCPACGKTHEIRLGHASEIRCEGACKTWILLVDPLRDAAERVAIHVAYRTALAMGAPMTKDALEAELESLLAETVAMVAPGTPEPGLAGTAILVGALDLAHSCGLVECIGAPTSADGLWRATRLGLCRALAPFADEDLA